MTMIVPVVLVALLAIAGGSERTIEAGENISHFAPPCRPCVWEYSFVAVPSEGIEVVTGSGILHGFYMSVVPVPLRVWNGEPGSDQIGQFGSVSSGSSRNVFYELNIKFDDGLYLDTEVGDIKVTLLYRSFVP